MSSAYLRLFIALPFKCLMFWSPIALKVSSFQFSTCSCLIFFFVFSFVLSFIKPTHFKSRQPYNRKEIATRIVICFSSNNLSISAIISWSELCANIFSRFNSQFTVVTLQTVFILYFFLISNFWSISATHSVFLLPSYKIACRTGFVMWLFNFYRYHTWYIIF